MKIVCVYHSIDLDGWMSAAIVKHWFNSTVEIPNKKDEPINTLNFIGYNYGQPIPDLSEYNKIIMCDISFPKEEMEKIATSGIGVSNFIWIDHHISAIKDVSETHFAKTTNGIRDTKFAACELTWKYFFPNEHMPEIVRLLGRYDCFGHKFTKEDENRRLTLLEYTKSTNRWMTKEEQDELANLNIKLLEESKVLEFQYGARQCISNYEESYNYLLKVLEDEKYGDYSTFSVTKQTVNKIHTQGKSIYQYLCTEAKQSYKNGFEIRLFTYTEEDHMNPHKFICINKERFNPINFGIDYHKDGYDGCACFYYANEMWNFSLYNDDGQVDCSQIAKQYGGGGHKGAAGFVTKDLNLILKGDD